MTGSDKYTTETITEIKSWTPKLFSFRTTRFRGYRFIPGQFARLGVRKQSPEGEKIVWRAYSIVSADYDEFLEFYSTGTGLAPFISILYDLKTWEQYENIVLVHGVRFKDELAYEELIRSFKDHEFFGEFAHQLKYVQVVTRDEIPGALHKRIPQLLADGDLESSTGIRIDPERARIMICGNPKMVDNLRKHFLARGYTLSRRGNPGHLAVENLW